MNTKEPPIQARPRARILFRVVGAAGLYADPSVCVETLRMASAVTGLRIATIAPGRLEEEKKKCEGRGWRAAAPVDGEEPGFGDAAREKCGQDRAENARVTSPVHTADVFVAGEKDSRRDVPGALAARRASDREVLTRRAALPRESWASEAAAPVMAVVENARRDRKGRKEKKEAKKKRKKKKLCR